MSDSSESSSPEPAPAACLERSKRSTAGTRMSSLVGKAAEEDDAFWSQSFFEEEDEDNESFRSSDESTEHQIDTFDSDFDESEGEEEANAQEVARGKVMEAEIAKEQRRAAESKSKKGFVEGGNSIVKQLMQKKIGRERKKRALLRGEGVQAGLVLREDGGSHPESSQSNIRSSRSSSSAVTVPIPTDTLRKSTRVKTSKLDPLKVMDGVATKPTTTTAATATATSTTTSTSTGNTAIIATTSSLKKTKRRYTQEELLLEALEITESENKKWLLARKRDMAQTEEEKHVKDVSDLRVIQKFNSRRGCYNTLTFPEMDHIPAIFDSSKRIQYNHKTQQNASICVITGKKARYRDPKTMLGYHDIEAFQELRRKLEKGEFKMNSTKQKKMATNKVLTVPCEVQSGVTGENINKENIIQPKKKPEKKTGKISKDPKRLKATKETSQSNAGATPNVVPSTNVSIHNTENQNLKAQEHIEVVDVSRSGRKRKKSEKMMAADTVDNCSTKVTQNKLVKLCDESISTNTNAADSEGQDSVQRNTTVPMSMDSTKMVQPSSEQYVEEPQVMISAPTIVSEAPIVISSAVCDIRKEDGNMSNMNTMGLETATIRTEQMVNPPSSFPCFSAASLDIASMFAMSLTTEQGTEKSQNETVHLNQNTSNGSSS